MHSLALLVTRDRGLIENVVKPSEVESLSIECVDSLAGAIGRLKLHDDVQALVVDLSELDKHEHATLGELLLVAATTPVLVVGEDMDLIRHASLLEQGAQDLLLKSQLNGGGLRQAVRNAMARKAREVALSDDNERARVTLSSIGDAVLSTDGNWLVSFVNPIAEKLLGWTCAQALGRHISEVFQVLDGTTYPKTWM